MTTLCLCDWVETRSDRQRRLAAAAEVETAPPDAAVPHIVADAPANGACVPPTAIEPRCTKE